MNTEPARAAAGEAVPDLDAAADEAIALCGGARAAVKELLVTKHLLEQELELAKATNSYGFTRGWHFRGTEPSA
jgi:hypothetical protein